MQEPDNNIDEYGVPVHQFDYGKSSQFRISLAEFQGKVGIDIRRFYLTADGFRPTPKGVRIPKDLYPELLQGIVLLGQALGFDDETINQILG